MQLVSYLNDNNIFHIFWLDIIKYYNSNYSEAIIDSTHIDIEHPTQKWRFFVMKKLYGNVIYSNNNTLQNNQTYPGFDVFNFNSYDVCPHICKIYKTITPDNKTNEKYILVNQRNFDDRYLYEYDTKLKLEDFLQLALQFPIKICNFNNMEPEEQYQICSNCSLFISAHGAGCTNIIFTQQDTPLIEINFRKHWYCDPVCDDHMNNNINVNQKCDGRLCFVDKFHKADYHNLCRLLGKQYIELEAVEYADGFNNRNPISKKKIFINGDELVNHIEKILLNK